MKTRFHFLLTGGYIINIICIYILTPTWYSLIPVLFVFPLLNYFLLRSLNFLSERICLLLSLLQPIVTFFSFFVNKFGNDLSILFQFFTASIFIAVFEIRFGVYWKKLITLWLIFSAPFFVHSSIVLLEGGSIHFIISIVSPLIIALLYFLLQIFMNNSIIATMAKVILFLAFGYLFAYPIRNEYIALINIDPIVKKINAKDLIFIDEKGHEISLPEGKVIVLDFWHSKCGICFKKFPEFISISNSFKRSDIKFYLVNKPITSDSVNTYIEMVKPYKIKKLKITEETEKILNIPHYPYQIIFDKKGNMVFKGNFNPESKLNNPHDIIKKFL